MKAPTLSRLFVALIAFTSVLATARADEAYQKEVRVTTLIKTQTDAAGRKIEYPKTGTPEVTGVYVEIPVGKETGWHVHPNPGFAYVLEGVVTVEREDGTKLPVKAGEVLAEVVNLKHNGRNTGTVPVKLVMFVLGTKDAPVSVKTK